MKRNTYKRILGLLYSGCLAAYYLWMFIMGAISPASQWGIWGKDILFLPVIGFLLAAAVTLPVWIFLRLTIKVEPLTGEEREEPLLQRFTYLQLFAFTGTLTAAMVYAFSFFTHDDFPSDDTFCTAFPAIALFVVHLAVAALAAFLLYAGARARHFLLSLLCFPALLAVYAGDYLAISVLVNDCCQEIKDNSPQQEIADTEPLVEDTAWIEQANNSVIRYFREYGWDEERDSSASNEACYTFTRKLLYDYNYLRNPTLTHDGILGYDLLTEEDSDSMQKLAAKILGWGEENNTEDEQEEIYQLVSSKILPGMLQTLGHGNLYRSSGLGQLVDMLDYAYYDLQYPREDKLSLLYDNLVAQQINWENAAGLTPYLGQPHALFDKHVDDPILVWTYSFWARRWADNRIGLCRRLLDDILKVYPNTTYTPDEMKNIEQKCHDERLQRPQPSKENLLAEIRNAFADVPRPERNELILSSPDDSERAQTGDQYARYEWADVPQDLLREKQNALHFFTAEAFHYYMPAFLISVVDDYRAGENMNNTLVWTLTYHLNNPEVHAMQTRRFEAFSDVQGVAVCHALEWLLAEHGADFINPADESSDLWHAIDSWWVRYD